MSILHQRRLIAFRTLLLAGCVCVALTGSAMAQNADFTLPGSADPSRTGLNPDVTAPQRDSASAGIVVEEPAVTAPPGFDEVTLTLNDVRLVGMTRYARGDFAPVIDRLKGKSINLAQVYDIVAAITEAYRRDGYVLTRVFLPPQEIENGVVTIQIIEGYVADVKVTGDYENSYLLRNTVAQIKAMRPLNIEKLERYLLLLNDLPHTTVQGIFEPVANDSLGEGAVVLILDMSREDAVYTLGYNNFGSRYLGPHQAMAGAEFADVGLAYSQLSLGGLVSIPTSESKSVSASYLVPVTAEGTTFSTDASANFTLPGYTLRELELDGISKQIAFSLSHPVIRSRAKNLTFTAALTARNSETDVLTDRLYDDKLRTLAFGGSYDFIDSFSGSSVLGANVVKGLDMFGARETGSEDLSREFGESDFTKITATASRTQFLPGGYQLFGAVSGQYAYDPLLSSEEFGFGGSYMGRAYDNSEIIGDRGFGTVIEARYKPIQLPRDSAVQPFLFYDFGKVWNIDPNDDTNVSASSVGIGTRFVLFGTVTGEAQVAQPLTKPIETPLYGSPDMPRVLFSLNTSF